MTVNTAKDAFHWKWNECLAPFVELWQRDKLFVFIFLIGSLFIGQIGVFGSLALAGASPAVRIAGVWQSNVEAAALYTFAITLLSAAVVAQIVEVIDKQRSGEGTTNSEYKWFWAIVAIALIIFQAMLAGNLIAKSSLVQPSPPAVADATAQPQGPGVQPVQKTASSSVSGQVDKAWHEQIGRHIPGLQVLLWLLSMVTAFELFCLQRNPLVPDTYAARRTHDLVVLADKADGAHSTSFGERI